MIENIWGCQSALSACSDLCDLVMVRWDKQQEWSPWNTILLTKDEADAHIKLCNLQEVKFNGLNFFPILLLHFNRILCVVMFDRSPYTHACLS